MTMKNIMIVRLNGFLDLLTNLEVSGGGAVAAVFNRQAQLRQQTD